jgi:hypothetical protein
LSAIEGNGDDFGINIASDATLSGTAIGSLKAEAFSTATNSNATLGQSSDLVGANLGDLHVGGVANLTGAAQLNGASTASSVDGASRANAGRNATVTGLQASEFDVASDATVTAQAFGTLNSAASSTGGDAFARAGNERTELTGLADGLEMNIGGVGTLSALAQGAQLTLEPHARELILRALGRDAGADFAGAHGNAQVGVTRVPSQAIVWPVSRVRITVPVHVVAARILPLVRPVTVWSVG